MDIPQEELHGCQSLIPNWPSEGCIMFQNVSLRYLPSLPDSLHDITFTISGGTQVMAYTYHLNLSFYLKHSLYRDAIFFSCLPVDIQRLLCCLL